MTSTTRSQGAAREPTPLLAPPGDAFPCGGDCSGCAAAAPQSESIESADPNLAGWKLAATSFAVFCMPVALAITGAGLWGGGATGQLAGGICGFALGAVLMRSITRRTDFEEREIR